MLDYILLNLYENATLKDEWKEAVLVDGTRHDIRVSKKEEIWVYKATVIKYFMKKYDVSSNVFDFVYDKLLGEQFIETKDGGIIEQCKIAHKGAMFIQNGGYCTRQRKETSKQQLQDIQTLALVLGTLAAGIAGFDYLVSDAVTRSILVSILLSVLAALIVPIITYIVKTRLLKRNQNVEVRNKDSKR